jgi:PKD repeat protein
VYSDDITVYEPVTADFTADVTYGPAPLTVHFSDLSRGPVAAWEWSFGDGQTSVLQAPVHVYVDSGAYEVSLTVRLAGEAAAYPRGTDILARTDYVVTGPRTYLPIVMRVAR